MVFGVVILGLWLALPGAAAEAGSAGPLSEAEKELVAEAFQRVERHGREVWPDFDAGDAPVLLIVGETEYLLNTASPPPGFMLQEGVSFRNRPIFARPRVFPPMLKASFPAIGRETVVIGTAEQARLSPTAWIYVLAHELFHVFQASRGLNQKITALAIGPPDDSDWHLNFPFPYSDAEVAGKLRELGAGLRAALEPGAKSKQQFQAEARGVASSLEELRAVLERKAGDARAYNYFRYQTGKEGVARYVESRLVQEAAQEGDPAATALLEERYAGQLARLNDAQIEQRQRSQFYVIGLGLALLLDRLGPEWKDRYFEEGVWLDDLVRTSLGSEAGAASGQ